MAMRFFDLDKDARKESWTYNPDGKTKEEQRSPGDDVTIFLYNVPEENQLFGRVILKPNAHHGKIVAEETCYYYVLSGNVDFLIYCNGSNDGHCSCGKTSTGCNSCHGKYTIDRRILKANEAVKIEKGTLFDYCAGLLDVAEVMLFRNYASV